MIFRLRQPTVYGYQRWFAWFPVPVSPYDGEYAWLGWVEREKDDYAGGITGYQYRSCKQ